MKRALVTGGSGAIGAAICERLARDGGLRYSGQGLGDLADFAPRLGAAYSFGPKTVFRAGVGIFDDRVPLLAGDFTANPTRVATFFDRQGMPIGLPVTYRNAYLSADHTLLPNHPNVTPFAVTWSVEGDRQLRPKIALRLTYLSSRTYNELVVNPAAVPAIGAVLGLSATGTSSYQEFEATLHLRPAPGSEWNISYVHGHAHGDLNTIEQIYVPFEQPVIRPNFIGRLASDVPNRLIAWGRFSTHFWGIWAGPLIDLHSGFPYSNIDVRQNYVGSPNSQRFPRFFSLDLKLGREFQLPLPWIRDHKLQGELTILNLTDHANPRDVYNNIASPNFGHFVGFQHRFYDTSLGILY